MKITIEKATVDDLSIVQNLGRFYAYEMYRYCGFLKGWEMPSNGLYECNDLSSYWKEPNSYPFLIRVDNELAGFVLINKLGSTPEVDWNMGEFFIVSKFQGMGVGRYVAEKVFTQLPGVWEVMQMPENKGAITFWEKVITDYTKGQFNKTHKMIAKPQPHPMIVLRLDTQQRSIEPYRLMLDDFLQTVASFSQKIDAIIFDCDGILVDSEHVKFLAWQTALASKNIEFFCEEYMPLAGYSSKTIYQKIQELKKRDIPADVIDLRRDFYKKLHKEKVTPIEEMVAFVKQLAKTKEQLNIKLGVASSASQQEILFNLQKIGLENSFDVIVSGADDLECYEDPEGKNKPKPYIYIEAAKRLSVPTSRCLVFEDTCAGITAATSAGMIAIAVPNQYTKNHDFSKAVKIMTHFLSKLQ